jgi:hypothetical protein
MPILRYADVDHEEVGAALNTLIDGINRHARVLAALANAAGQTLTVAQFVNAILVRSGAAGVSDTTPSAAAIVAALAGCMVGSTFEFTVVNQNTGTLTLVAGTGVTLNGTATCPTVNTIRWIGQVTNPNPGAEAVTLQRVGVQAN